MLIEAKLKAMGLELPKVSPPAGLYVPAKRVGNLLYLSGQTPDIDGELQYEGVVGEDFSVEQAYAAARLAGLNLLAAVKQALGDLDAVAGFVQVLGYVRSAPGFTEHPKVINGASQLFRDLYGEAGVSTRMALGTNELPEGSPVEIMAVVEIKQGF
ncbi:MAG: RidA family protein [Duodenibacillus sp.]|nr:RidA family protein [Duodenibacillus sp.]